MTKTHALQMKRKNPLSIYRMYSIQEDEIGEVSNILKENFVPLSLAQSMGKTTDFLIS